MPMHDHFDVGVLFVNLAVYEPFQVGRGAVRVDGLGVRNAVLADVVETRHESRC